MNGAYAVVGLVVIQQRVNAANSMFVIEKTVLIVKTRCWVAMVASACDEVVVRKAFTDLQHRKQF